MLVLRGAVALPPPAAAGSGSEFDHGDVHRVTGQVYVAHTAADTVEVIDGERGAHMGTIPGCPEGSGVLCAQEDDLVFAAARGAGRVLILAALEETSAGAAVLREVRVGPRPNGLAWDPQRKHLLVADVQDNRARLIDPFSAPEGRILVTSELPGRPRWCVYDRERTRFLVNVREPACVVVLAADTGYTTAQWPVSSAGPHGLDLDPADGRAFVACDGGMVVALDLETGHEQARVAIPGVPDAIWYNAPRQRLYVAIGDPGVVAIVNTRTMTVEEEVRTEVGAHTTAFDAARQRLYVFLPQTCRAAVYEEV
jgi:DNA-binding beta-propeller fold protein YncE